MKNKRIHPSPLPSSSSSSSSLAFLSCLPTALLALASTLSPQEQEVLSYLLDSEKPKSKKAERKQQKSHGPNLDCSCFGCYKSFWAVWDSSPNRHVIHLILDEYEARLEGKNLVKSGSKGKSKKKKSSLKKSTGKGVDFEKGADADVKKDVDCGGDGYNGYFDDVYEEEEEEKGSIRKFMSWVFGINECH